MGTLGKPEPELLEALLDGMNLERLAERARAAPTADLLETALVIFVQVYEFMQTCTREQRSQLRTCSPQLIALGMDRARHLEALQRRELERAREQQEAKQRLEHLTGAARVMCGQALEVLAKVGGSELADAGPPPELASAPPALLARALGEIAARAKAMLGNASTKVQLRTVLYGLDRSYVESLVEAAVELDRLLRSAQDQGAGGASPRELDETRAVTLFMVNHFVGAFDAARRSDKTIPVLDARRIAVVKPSADGAVRLPVGGVPAGVPGARRP